MSRQPRFLFVDDEQRVLQSLQRALHAHTRTWDLRFASTADEALQVAHAMSVDVIVTDVNMPGRDGLDLLRSLQVDKDTADIAVIVLTGAGDRSLKRRALALGAMDLLNKPVITEDLVARLHSALRVKQCQDELRRQNAQLDKLVDERTAALEWSRMEIIWRLAKVGEYRDEQTGDHVVRVGSYSRLIASRLGMSDEFADTLLLTSALHDIGKVGVSDAVLLKPGALDELERQAMQRHCEIGHSILQQDAPGVLLSLRLRGIRIDAGPAALANPVLKQAAVIALSHHEKWDGTGYPRGLRGETIPLEARIVTIVDVYDALSHARPYKPAFPQEEVLTIMRSMNSSHFDPAVFEVFTQNIDAVREVDQWLEGQAKAA